MNRPSKSRQQQPWAANNRGLAALDPGRHGWPEPQRARDTDRSLAARAFGGLGLGLLLGLMAAVAIVLGRVELDILGVLFVAGCAATFTLVLWRRPPTLLIAMALAPFVAVAAVIGVILYALSNSPHLM